jgi:hypothetical protein
MVAGPTKIVAQTTLVFDGFDSNRRLGSRLIRRIAERRANAQFLQAQAIAQRDNEAEILRAFDKRLDSQLAFINGQIGIARYVRSLLGPASKPRMASCSTKGCILVGIGNAEDPQKLLACPPDCQSHAPLEIWIHRSILGERLVSFTSVLQKLDQGVVLTPPQFEVLQLMPGLRTADRPFALSFTEGWLVIGVPRDPETIVLASSNR